MINDVLQHAANRILLSDPQSREKLAELEGKSVGVDVKGTNLHWLVSVTREGLSLNQEPVDGADCILRGSAIALARYMNAKEINPSTNYALGVEIQGDLEFAHKFSNLFRNLDVDWEEIFSQFMGDLPAHQFARALSNFRAGFQRSTDSAQQHIKYIISEKLDQVVNQDEAEAFYREVDQLSARADRLEQQIKKIKKDNNNA